MICYHSSFLQTTAPTWALVSDTVLFNRFSIESRAALRRARCLLLRMTSAVACTIVVVLVLALPTVAVPGAPLALQVSATRKVLRRARTPTMALFDDGSAGPAGGSQLLALTAGSHAGAGAPCETPVSFTNGDSWSCGDASSPGRAGGLQLNGFVPHGFPHWWCKLGDTLTPAGSGFQLTATLIQFAATDPAAGPPPIQPAARPQPVVSSPVVGDLSNGTAAWQCAGVSPLPTAAGTNNRLALPLQRCQPEPGYPWRGENVTAVLCETHLLTGRYKISGDATNSSLRIDVEWQYSGLIASRSTIEGAAAAEAVSPFPFYFASEPSLVALSPRHWVVAMRASADDDDGNRPLDPAAVMSNSSTFADWDDAIAGFCMYKGVFKPTVDSSSQFFTGKARNAPLAFARTTDGGATWRSAMMAPDQGVGVLPRLAFDPVTNVLLLSYGSLSYPRRGHGLLTSTDSGMSWGAERQIDSMLTSGYTWLTRVGPGKFVLALDAAPPQSGCGGPACDPRCSPMGEAFWVGVATITVDGPWWIE